METAENDKIVLNEGQQNALDGVIKWASDVDYSYSNQIMTLGGDAGTGKTTVIREIVNNFPSTVVAAFTGKAAYVLRNKGVDASTVHSLIYRYEPKTDEFVLRDYLASKPRLIIIDEGSMINEQLFNDLTSFGIKVLFVGDPKQLEPIGGDPNLMKDLDFQLTEIHRQAAESPIIQFSQVVANGLPFRDGTMGDLRIALADEFTAENVLKHDQALCGFNRTRVNINNEVRALLGHRGILDVGEKVICLQNNHRLGVLNGMLCTVVAILEEKNSSIKAEVEDDLGTVRVVDMIKAQFGSAHKRDDYYSRVSTLWDYGYCITCHKSQGSEWDSVIAFEELWNKWDPRRWRYTAVTRAANKLTYCV